MKGQAHFVSLLDHLLVGTREWIHVWCHLLGESRQVHPPRAHTLANRRSKPWPFLAFPLIFGSGNDGHGWTSLGLINSTYLSFVIGAFIGFFLQPLQERYYHRAVARNGGKSDPEARWYSSLYGIWWLPLGLFIAAWTSYPDLPFIAPLIGFTLFGGESYRVIDIDSDADARIRPVGFYMVIAAILNYVVDGYGHYSAVSRIELSRLPSLSLTESFPTSHRSPVLCSCETCKAGAGVSTSLREMLTFRSSFAWLSIQLRSGTWRLEL